MGKTQKLPLKHRSLYLSKVFEDWCFCLFCIYNYNSRYYQYSFSSWTFQTWSNIESRNLSLTVHFLHQFWGWHLLLLAKKDVNSLTLFPLCKLGVVAQLLQCCSFVSRYLSLVHQEREPHWFLSRSKEREAKCHPGMFSPSEQQHRECSLTHPDQQAAQQHWVSASHHSVISVTRGTTGLVLHFISSWQKVILYWIA